MNTQPQNIQDKKSLSTTLALAFFTLSVVVLLISSGLQLFNNIQTQEQAIASNQQLIAQNAAKTVSGFIQKNYHTLETAIWLNDPLTISQDEQKRTLESLLSLQPAIRQMALLDTQGEILALVSRHSIQLSEEFRDQVNNDNLVYMTTKHGERYISSTYIDQATGEPTVTIAVPVINVFGDAKGALFAEVSLKFMWDTVGRLRVGETGQAYVVDRQGNLLAFSNVSRVLRNENVANLDAVSEFIQTPDSAQTAGNSIIYPGITETTVVGTYAPLGTPDWAVVIELPWREAYRDIVWNTGVSVAIVLGISILAGLLGVIIAHRLTRPLINLTNTAARIADGERALQAEISGPRETASLALAFNSMTTQLRQILEGLEQEIIERKQAQATLQQNEAVLRATMESIHDGILVITEDKRVSQYNSRFCEIWSIPDEIMASGKDDALVGYVLPQLVEPEQFTARIEDVYLTSKTSEDFLKLKDGRTLDRHSYPLVQEDIEWGRVWLFRDITERKQTQTALQESRQMLQTVLDTIPVRVFWKDRNLVYLGCNQAFAHDGGLTSPQEIIGMEDFELPWVKQAKLYRTDDLQVIQSEAPKLNYEEPQNGPDGKKIWLRTSKIPLRDVDSNIIGVLGTYEDITERKQAEEITQLRLKLIDFAVNHSLAELQQKALDEVEELTNSPIGFFHYVEADQKNLSLQAWSTRTLEEFCQAKGEGLHYPIDKAGVWANCVRESRPIIHNDYEALPNRKGLPEGHAEVIRELVVPIIRNDLIVGIFGVGNKSEEYTHNDCEMVEHIADLIWEIMERKRVEDEVHLLNEKLEQRVLDRTAQLDAANKELEAFSYSVSHDLRAPLRAIDGFSLFLIEDYADQLSAEATRLLVSVRNNAQQMGNLIDGLLQLSRLGRKPINKRSIDSIELIHQVLETLQNEFIGRDIDIQIGELPTCQGDPILLKQVWINLLSNALKYTLEQEKTSIEIGRKEENGVAVYFVKDNGVGFDMQYANKLFGVFQRLHNSDKFEGTGVGLAIVQRIIHRHGGRIWAHAEPDVGATFYFTI